MDISDLKVLLCYWLDNVPFKYCKDYEMEYCASIWLKKLDFKVGGPKIKDDFVPTSLW